MSIRLKAARRQDGSGRSKPSVGMVLGLICLLVLTAVAVSACGGGSSSSGGSSSEGSSSEGSSGGEGSSGTESSEGNESSGSTEGGEIVYFALTKADTYMNTQHKEMEAEAAELGYTIKFIEDTNYSASEQNEQVQQYLASGQKPKAFMIFPLDSKAAVGLAAQLSRVAPVFQINQKVTEGGFEYVTAYVGPNDVLIGETAGETIGKLRDQLEKEGVKMKTPGGGVLGLNALPGLAVTINRGEGLETGLEKENVTLLEDAEGASTPEATLSTALQLIPKYKDKMDFIYTTNNEFVAGAIKAAEQNGLTPGKDVWIVTGNCSGSAEVMKNGQVYGTGGQFSTVEGAVAVQTVAKYFANGEEVAEGSEVLEASKAKPEVDLSTAPKKEVFLPNPALIGKNALEGEVWGQPKQTACAAQ